MSKQLSLSATFSALAMAALALMMALVGPTGGDGARGATAHGLIVSVLLRA